MTPGTECPDGARCHHQCNLTCWRVRTCLPLSASGWEQWPREIVIQHATPDGLVRVEDVLIDDA